MGTVNGGTIISFTPTPSLHAVSSRMPAHHPTGCANFTFQIPSIANAAKKNTNSAERRANHNAVERARRECLNTKFQELAHALPSLAQVRRPSKSIIVQKSLDFIYNARQKDESHDKEMLSIRNENDLLREEVNKLREKLGLEPYKSPREESNPSTSQQADEVKEDASISNSSRNSNSPEIKIEADNNTTTTTNAQESTNSIDIQIKTEECRSDDDISNGNTEEDYELETPEMIDGKNTDINQPIDNHHQQQQCIYDSLIGYPLLDQHNYSTSEFNFMDISPIDHHIVDPNSIHLPFEHTDQLSDELGVFCEFPLQQKIYPSPPYEATMLEIANQMPCYSLSADNAHNM